MFLQRTRGAGAALAPSPAADGAWGEAGAPRAGAALGWATSVSLVQAVCEGLHGAQPCSAPHGHVRNPVPSVLSKVSLTHRQVWGQSPGLAQLRAGSVFWCQDRDVPGWDVPIRDQCGNGALNHCSLPVPLASLISRM